MNMGKQYSFEDFVKIVEELRGENGCPWDRKQTHESLRPCMMEEAAELISAIRIYDRTGNPENMREELGDILLQVVMHSQIAKEEGLFTLEDVVDEISAKMVRRHPHVFGQEERDGDKEILSNWEEIKRREKAGKAWIESPLREIPRELPALTRAAKVLKKAGKLYGRAKGHEDNLRNLELAAGRLKDLGPSGEAAELEKAIGDILWNLSAIAGRCGIAQEQILTDRIEEMIDCCEPLENLEE